MYTKTSGADKLRDSAANRDDNARLRIEWERCGGEKKEDGRGKEISSVWRCDGARRGMRMRVYVCMWWGSTALRLRRARLDSLIAPSRVEEGAGEWDIKDFLFDELSIVISLIKCRGGKTVIT